MRTRTANRLALAGWTLTLPIGVVLRWLIDRALDKSGRTHPR